MEEEYGYKTMGNLSPIVVSRLTSSELFVVDQSIQLCFSLVVSE